MQPANDRPTPARRDRFAWIVCILLAILVIDRTNVPTMSWIVSTLVASVVASIVASVVVRRP